MSKAQEWDIINPSLEGSHPDGLCLGTVWATYEKALDVYAKANRFNSFEDFCNAVGVQPSESCLMVVPSK